MHACLNVDEIVRHIALELVMSGGKATAVCLACCCKSFEDLVLDALWAEQRLLLPLLKTFPGDVWKDGGCSVSALTTYVFLSRYLRQLSAGSWRRGADIIHVSKPHIRRGKPRSQPSIQSHLFQPHHMLVLLRNSSGKAEEYQAAPAPAAICTLI